MRVAQKRKGFQRAGLLQSTGQSVPGKSGAGSAAGARIPGGKGAFCKRQAKLSDIGAKRVNERAAARGGVPRDAEKENAANATGGKRPQKMALRIAYRRKGHKSMDSVKAGKLSGIKGLQG